MGSSIDIPDVVEEDLEGGTEFKILCANCEWEWLGSVILPDDLDDEEILEEVEEIADWGAEHDGESPKCGSPDLVFVLTYDE